MQVTTVLIVVFSLLLLSTCGPSWMDNCYTINCPTCPEGEKEVSRVLLHGECCPQLKCELPCVIAGTGYEVGDTIPIDPAKPCEARW